MRNHDYIYTIITAGPNYLDIDAYACIVAMAELLNLQGEKAVAYSQAPYNYSVCQSLAEQGQVLNQLPVGCDSNNAKYIIVDVSDPNFLRDSVPLNNVIEVYDHHAGFEEYWTSRIGDGSHIEFIGAAATLIYSQWIKAGLQDKMKRSTACLLMAAILDNTLNLMSSNTTDEDITVYTALCNYANEGESFRDSYFSEVQKSVEADLKNALKNDIKYIGQDLGLPPYIAQLCVWNSNEILKNISHIRSILDCLEGGWMLNLIDIKHKCSYFVCDDSAYQKKIEMIFKVYFESGVAKSTQPYLRKQIIKNMLNSK